MRFLSLLIPTLFVMSCASQPANVRKTSSAKSDRGQMIYNCYAPFFDGEMQIFKNLSKKTYTVSLSGVEDYPTEVVSSGPTGLFLSFKENEEEMLFYVDNRADQEAAGSVATRKDPKKIIQAFKCTVVR